MAEQRVQMPPDPPAPVVYGTAKASDVWMFWVIAFLNCCSFVVVVAVIPKAPATDCAVQAPANQGQGATKTAAQGA